ncbi:unnamed protein product [Closterium sp. NIES-53]
MTQREWCNSPGDESRGLHSHPRHHLVPPPCRPITPQSPLLPLPCLPFHLSSLPLTSVRSTLLLIITRFAFCPLHLLLPFLPFQHRLLFQLPFLPFPPSGTNAQPISFQHSQSPLPVVQPITHYLCPLLPIRSQHSHCRRCHVRRLLIASAILAPSGLPCPFRPSCFSSDSLLFKAADAAAAVAAVAVVAAATVAEPPLPSSAAAATAAAVAAAGAEPAAPLAAAATSSQPPDPTSPTSFRFSSARATRLSTPLKGDASSRKGRAMPCVSVPWGGRCLATAASKDSITATAGGADDGATAGSTDGATDAAAPPFFNPVTPLLPAAAASTSA